MPNPIADFMRNEIAMRERGLKLGIAPRQYNEADFRLFFLKAADEIDRLEAALLTDTPETMREFYSR